MENKDSQDEKEVKGLLKNIWFRMKWLQSLPREQPLPPLCLKGAMN
jgi:hypothetical protein